MLPRAAPGPLEVSPIRSPGSGSMRSTTWFGSHRDALPMKRSRGGRRNTSRTSVTRAASALPALMKNGTPAQRQLSTSSRRAAKVSVVDPLATPGTSR